MTSSPICDVIKNEVETLMSNPNYEERNSRKEMEMDLWLFKKEIDLSSEMSHKKLLIWSS